MQLFFEKRKFNVFEVIVKGEWLIINKGHHTSYLNLIFAKTTHNYISTPH